MSLIDTQLPTFKANAHQNGKFVPVINESIKGKWSVFVFFPAAFTFVCPTELGDPADNYAEFQNCVFHTGRSCSDLPRPHDDYWKHHRLTAQGGVNTSEHFTVIVLHFDPNRSTV